ncbi:helix-turn-helix domain-containing protein [Glycomyces sp. TRM65418]|uniref:GlxA family transcriptional regulator n=1 Tax=Glycomyces sp. TRM65418 TaxID=2867006 RepID=UPI001CE60E7F|nr:helix-turn-helix domain-containing protein [Glycomyces sp. TRM65418]MCC3765277.1 helix-turn-helix domain-containing protein [Glycomyces sp. TRM65418]QZD54898.1 helix-turn-helix domain-containing protein [Glycomyces sp. TRM65418]
MRDVAVLAVPPVKPFDLSMPSTLFEDVQVEGRPGYRVTVCTAEPGVIASSGGFDLVIADGLEALETADTVIVPSSGRRHDADAATLEALRQAAAAGRRIASICSGAFILAQAGLLDGRPATTHWALAEELREAHPSVSVDPNVLFVDDGAILTGAGSAAGIDLCLHLVRCDYGAAAANAAARAAVVTPVRQGGQAQFVETPLPPVTGSSLAEARVWALGRLDRAISLDDLAREANVSVRTLARRFIAETGTTPFQWLLQQRLHRARELLEATDLSVDQVARRSGFGTAESLRQHMARHLGLTPSAYRAAFTRAPASTR